jgi:hypothetical protein
MKSEMDLLRMDERQRLCWLFANRAMIFIIGAIWLCMIGYELLHGRTRWFMIAMVPVLALTRLIIYLYYSKRLESRGSVTRKE